MTASRGRLIVIDDEEDLREMLEFLLSRDGFEVVTVDSGMAAVALARDQKFDLAITDLKMPGMNGIETLTALKALDPSLQVIIATGYATDQAAAECMRRGAYGYLRKPFELADLRAVVERALDERAQSIKASSSDRG
jgi:DNA-binding NtrC family response regulator